MKSSDFRPLSTSPLNGAPAPAALIGAHLTSAEHFFVRNHGDIPAAPSRSVRVHGLVTHTLDVAALALPRAAVEATLQCAGNRRTGLQSVRPIPNEVPWPNEAIGNAIWEGVSLAAVLERAGLADGAAHVWLTGSETLSGKHAGEQFGASIPLDKAMSGNVILADSMNGAPLSAMHGAPVRAIVPGYIGARSVKWLSEIRVAAETTDNYFQRAYSLFPPSVLAVPAEHAGGSILEELPVNSAFASHEAGAHVRAGSTRLTGWAMTGGDRLVERVEASADGGATWVPGTFSAAPRRFVWCRWECDVTLVPGPRELVCRAFDDAGRAQPAHAADVWNVKGYMNNSWHRVRVLVSD